jgi:hypothetical protein
MGCCCLGQGSLEVQERGNKLTDSISGSGRWRWRLSDFFWVLFLGISAYLTA